MKMWMHIFWVVKKMWLGLKAVEEDLSTLSSRQEKKKYLKISKEIWILSFYLLLHLSYSVVSWKLLEIFENGLLNMKMHNLFIVVVGYNFAGFSFPVMLLCFAAGWWRVHLRCLSYILTWEQFSLSGGCILWVLMGVSCFDNMKIQFPFSSCVFSCPALSDNTFLLVYSCLCSIGLALRKWQCVRDW